MTFQGVLMARRMSTLPTELELEILKILWRDGDSTVRHVRDALAEIRDLAHTTVITTMTVMMGKGYLQRVKKEKKFVYRPLLSRTDIEEKMVNDLVGKMFEGSPTALMLNLLSTSDINANELKQIAEYIDEMSKGEET